MKFDAKDFAIMNHGQFTDFYEKGQILGKGKKYLL